MAADVAAVVADSSGGNPGRARVMIRGPRRGGPGRAVVVGAGSAERHRRRGGEPGGPELLASADRAVEPLRADHARELERLTEEAKEFGEKGLPGRKEITDRHPREERRWRTDALRAGLGALARCVSGSGGRGEPASRARPTTSTLGRPSEAVALITEATQALPRNPQESLLLQSLLVRLGALTV